MKSRFVVVADVGVKHTAQRVFTEDKDMVHALPAYGTDDPFDIGPLPRRVWGTEDFLDANVSDLPAELISVDTITVSQQVLWGRVKRKRVEKLLRGPLRSRMRGHIEVNNPSSLMSKHDEDQENLERNGGNRKAVD
jgi:hypothetical protein